MLQKIQERKTLQKVSGSAEISLTFLRIKRFVE
jgi:hypothetical protein